MWWAILNKIAVDVPAQAETLRVLMRPSATATWASP
jgi:hypothetical protein